MALSNPSLPFGCRDVKITPIDDAGNLGTAVDLPAARIFSFKEVEEFEELEGDDVTQASHGAGPKVEWELEAGGLSIAAYKVLAGGSTIQSGVSPNLVNRFTKLTTQSRPYFQVEGQAISDSGGDLHTIVYRCKADGDLEGSFENGAFMLTKASGKGYGNLSNSLLYEFVQNESVTPIA